MTRSVTFSFDLPRVFVETRNIRANPSIVRKQPARGSPVKRDTETEDESLGHQ